MVAALAAGFRIGLWWEDSAPLVEPRTCVWIQCWYLFQIRCSLREWAQPRFSLSELAFLGDDYPIFRF